MKLGYMMLLVAVGTMLVIAPSAMGAKGGKGHDMGLPGKVTAVTEAGVVTIELMAKKDAPAAEKKTVTTDGKTEFVKGEKGAESPATITDVTEGAHVMVKLDADGKIATKVVIMPAKKK